MSMSEMKKNVERPERDVTLYLSDFSRGIRKFWWVCVLCAALCGGAALCWSSAQYVPLYQSSATFTVLIPNETLSESGEQGAYSFSYSRTTAERLAAALQYAARSSLLQKKVCEELGVSAMPATLSVEFATGTNLMTVSAQGENAQQTCAALLAFAGHYDDVTSYIIGPTKLVTIEEPTPAVEPCNALSRQQAAEKGALLGFALGAAWIVLYALLRQTVRTKADIRQELNQTCIGVLPQVTFKRHRRTADTRVLLSNPAVSGDFQESVRLLRSAVQSGLHEGEKVVLITGTAPEEGKSVVTVNLAASLAKSEKKVLVVDADLRNSGISKLLCAELEAQSKTDAAGLYRIRACASLGVDVLTFDTQAHALRQIVRTDQMRAVFMPLKASYDLILVDTPPCAMISDTAIIAGAADAALYVVRQDTVLASRIRSGLHALLSADIRLLGCVLNGATAGFGSYGYSYGYGKYRGYRGKYGAPRKEN